MKKAPREERFAANIVEELLILARVSTMWPALMLAARRIPKVRGRTRSLIDSIRTRGGDSQGGAPDGRRWAALLMGVWITQEIKEANHRGMLALAVIIICDESLKRLGIMPNRLAKRSRAKRAVI